MGRKRVDPPHVRSELGDGRPGPADRERVDGRVEREDVAASALTAVSQSEGAGSLAAVTELIGAQMADWPAFGVIVAAGRVAVTLAIFVIESSRRRADDRAGLKREAISRLLTTMETSI